MHELAIVVPAYKADFFEQAIASIAAQTDPRFRVYVGNDAGAPEIEEMCAAHPSLDLVYRYFPDNHGASSLTSQWERCIAMSTEPWVWLFSDDDVMAPDCVEAFLANLTNLDGIDLVRFRTTIVDQSGKTALRPDDPPGSESGVDFIADRLRGGRQSFAVEYIFRRAALDRIGGFVDFPVAWCSDDATWFLLSERGGIRTLPAGRVHWRSSGLNITAAKGRYREEKLEAAHRFLRFVDERVRPASTDSTSEEWGRIELRWLQSQIRGLMPMGRGMLAESLRRTQPYWPLPTALRLARLMVWNVRAAWGRTWSGLLKGRMR